MKTLKKDHLSFEIFLRPITQKDPWIDSVRGALKKGHFGPPTQKDPFFVSFGPPGFRQPGGPGF